MQKENLVGKVKDVAFAVGKMGIALTVENEAGETRTLHGKMFKQHQTS